MKKTHWHLDENEHVVAAWAEACSGPGWSNRPVWVLIRRNGTTALRIECLQPEQQGAHLWVLYDVANAVHSAMLAQVNALLRGVRPKRGALPLAEAKRLRVCRFCRKGETEGPGLPFLYDFGKEYAHEACLKRRRER